MILKTELLPFQEKVISHLLQWRVGALFAEMGTGKTRMALEIIKSKHGKFNKIWWLCPASIIEASKKELAKHCDLEIEILSIESFSSSKKTLERAEREVNIDDFVVIDESSLIKNWEAKRTQNILGLFSLCKYKLILNGTPTMNGISDLFSQMKFLSPKILGYRSYESFARAHLTFEVDRYGRRRVVREHHIDHLKKLSEPFVAKVTKNEVLKVAKSKEIVEVKMSELTCSNYRNVENEFFEYVKQTKDVNTHVVRSYLTKMQVLSAGILGDDIDILNKFLEIKKFQGNDKTIVFCKYIKEIDAMPTEFKIFGSTQKKERQLIISKFEKSNSSILAMTYGVGSFGLNLQFCNKVVFLSPNYNYGLKNQAEDRIHRVGQSKICQYLEFKITGTVEDAIFKALERKENILKTYMGIKNEKI